MPEALDANRKPVLALKDQKELENLRAEGKGAIKALKTAVQRKLKAMAEMAALLGLLKTWKPFCSEDAKGRQAPHRQKTIERIGETNADRAVLVSACREIGICLRTLKRWRNAFWVMVTALPAVKAVPAQPPTA